MDIVSVSPFPFLQYFCGPFHATLESFHYELVAASYYADAFWLIKIDLIFHSVTISLFKFFISQFQCTAASYSNS